MTVDPRLEELAQRTPNFGYLLEHEAVLVGYGAAAESMVFNDPNTSMIKARQFGGQLVSALITTFGIRVPAAQGTQHKRLKVLLDQGVINKPVHSWFNAVRDTGNKAMHEGFAAQRDALRLLRLPKGIFYAGGVTANVLFFDKQRTRLDKPWTSRFWVYDFRTGQHFTLRQRKLAREHLHDFVDCYLPGKPRTDRTETERFKAFDYADLIARDKANLDITLMPDPDAEDSDNLPPPEVIAQEIVDDLQAALNEFAAVAEALEAAKAARQEGTT